MDNVRIRVFMELLFCISRLVHMAVRCEKKYDVQLSSQILFSQLLVKSFKSFGAAVEWFIIVGRIQYVCR